MTPSWRLATRRVALILGAAWLAGCAAPTMLNTQWVNPQFAAKPPMRSILVLAITKDPTNRRNFEDQMVAQLAARGVKVVPSYRFAPDVGAAEQVKREPAVKEARVSGVLLTRVVNLTEQVNVSPSVVMGPPTGYGFGGFYGYYGYYGYYGGMWATSYVTPPTVHTTQHVAADTRLFETANYTLVWSASNTTTPSGGRVVSVFEQFSKLIVYSMAKDGLV